MAYTNYDWKPAFLAALREVPVLRHGCDVTGVHRTTVHKAREADPEFDKAVEQALEDGIDRAEQEAFRRGVHGFEEPVIDRGRLVYQYTRRVDEDGKEHYEPVLDANGQPVPLTVRKHSDTLLAKVLSARRAAYRTERTELTGAGGGPLVVDSTQRQARVAALLRAAAARRDADDIA